MDFETLAWIYAMGLDDLIFECSDRDITPSEAEALAALAALAVLQDP